MKQNGKHGGLMKDRGQPQPQSQPQGADSAESAGAQRMYDNMRKIAYGDQYWPSVQAMLGTESPVEGIGKAAAFLALAASRGLSKKGADVSSNAQASAIQTMVRELAVLSAQSGAELTGEDVSQATRLALDNYMGGLAEEGSLDMRGSDNDGMERVASAFGLNGEPRPQRRGPTSGQEAGPGPGPGPGAVAPQLEPSGGLMMPQQAGGGYQA